MKPYQAIGYSKESLYELAIKRGMHPGCANQLVEFAVELQRTALDADAQKRALAAVVENQTKEGV